MSNSDDEPYLTEVREEDDKPDLKRGKCTNKQKILVFCSRGVSYRMRHLMKDLQKLLPHSKAETKLDKKDNFFVINEICEMRNCNKCLFFETRKKQDVYLWAANIPDGPSARFLIENVHTLSELKMTGNCLRGSRPILSFSKNFDEEPHWKLLKELFTQILGTPLNHPKSQPFVDHVINLTIFDNRIWFRNYQILDEKENTMCEIGPRFCLNLIKIFDGSFRGEALYENPKYVSPNLQRRLQRRLKGNKYTQRVAVKRSRDERPPDAAYQNLLDDDLVFETDQKTNSKKKRRTL